MSSFESSAKVVHRSLEQVKRAQQGIDGASTLTPIPAYHLYKMAREEELLSYRSVCRVLAMHYGTLGDASLVSPPSSQGEDPQENSDGSVPPGACSLHTTSFFPKGAKRLLEDLQELWCINDERAKAEQLIAVSDPVIAGVYRSKVLQRRKDFFDGVDDVQLSTEVDEDVVNETLSNRKPTEDDGFALHMIEKKARMEWDRQESNESKRWNTRDDAFLVGDSNSSKPISMIPGASGSNGVGVRGGVRRKGNANIMADLTRLEREVKAAAQNFIYSADPTIQGEASNILDTKLEELLALRDRLTE